METEAQNYCVTILLCACNVCVAGMVGELEGSTPACLVTVEFSPWEHCNRT